MKEKVEQLVQRMLRHRADYDRMFESWYFRRISDSGKARPKIKYLLRKGKRVTTGYFCTSVRGYHEHYVFWKDYKRSN